VNKSDMPEAAHTNALRIMAALELNRRLAGSGVDVFCCHPGVTKTEVRATSRGLAW
jgi:NAD(P)-dependent dehydrogenase (short-subunit alcohol dehydrogenase family)